ncbi:MAG: IS66 family transposase [Chloroflexia bacterium]
MFTFCTAEDPRPSAGAEHLLRQQDEIIAALRAQLQQRDEIIAALRAQLQQREAVIAAQQEQNALLQEQVTRLQEQVRRLQEQLDDLNRTNKRQATPFARRKHVSQPKRPGRKKGQGRFSYRRRPAPTAVRETKIEPLVCCPACGGPVSARKKHEQYVVDIPPVEPVITRYVTESGYCAHCRQRVRSRHPEQTSAATGAAGVVIGPRAKALAADLKHRLGLSYGKVSDLVGEVFHLGVTRSGRQQGDIRLAEHFRPVYEELVRTLRASAVVHGDETGWRIGTLAAWLWVFTNQETTVYTIRGSRGHEVVVDILGREFRGTLVSDCFRAYDHRELAAWLKQKCVGHLLRNLSELEESKTRGAVRFARAVTALLRAALALKGEKADLPDTVFAERAAALEQRLDALIDERRRFTDPDNARFAKRLRKQRPHLLRFLYVDGLEATNERAERQLRPAVITRKTNGCNRTEGGAEAHAILASVLATCRQRASSILDFLVQAQRSTAPALGPP